METIGLLGMFGLCSKDDIKYKQVKVFVISIFGVLGVLLHVFFGKNSWASMLLGFSIGAILYFVSILTNEKIGKGDALIIAVAGIYLGALKTLELLWFSSLLAAIGGLILIVVKKKEKTFEMPFVPFMLLAYILMLVWEPLNGVML